MTIPNPNNQVKSCPRCEKVLLFYPDPGKKIDPTKSYVPVAGVIAL